MVVFFQIFVKVMMSSKSGFLKCYCLFLLKVKLISLNVPKKIPCNILFSSKEFEDLNMKSNCEKKYFILQSCVINTPEKNRIKENIFHGEGFLE